MPARRPSRAPRAVARSLAATLALVVAPIVLRAQAPALATDPIRPVVAAEAPTAPVTPSAPAGPVATTIVAGAARPATQADAVARREAARAAVAPRGQGLGQSQALMIVGGVAFIAGLLIGDDAGTAIAVGGAAVGLYGLYQYLR